MGVFEMKKKKSPTRYEFDALFILTLITFVILIALIVAFAFFGIQYNFVVIDGKCKDAIENQEQLGDKTIFKELIKNMNRSEIEEIRWKIKGIAGESYLACELFCENREMSCHNFHGKGCSLLSNEGDYICKDKDNKLNMYEI